MERTRDITALLADVDARPLSTAEAQVTGVAYRSDRVRPGDAFVCVRGFMHDGHDFAADAVSHGAAALVVERPLPDVDAPQFQVPDARVALAALSAGIYGHPSRRLKLFGITGTNGKTTTTYLLDGILRAAGHRTGVIGTVETRIGAKRSPAIRTTPESADLQALFADMADRGVTAVAMEVSSHALDLHRVDAMDFECVAFTNLTQDHLDYHHTLEEYYAVKRRLFTDFATRNRVANLDDPLGRDLVHTIPGTIGVGTCDGAEISAADVHLDSDGSAFTLATPEGSRQVRLPLAGEFNVSNALVAAGCAHAAGIPLDTIVAGLDAATQVPGRLERIDCGQRFSVIVDYAHTPDSLGKAIQAVAEVTARRVIVVFGCGGDRDPEKRPLMGRAAGMTADHAIVTSDNPRSEDPVGIVLQIEDGLRDSGASYEVEIDRRRAIRRALELAEPGDSVLIAGKGHEDYQIFADQKIHFDDREVAREELGRC